MQLTHQEKPFSETKFPLILVCDGIQFQPNIGSLFRICEAFGVEKIIFYGLGEQMNLRKINRTSRNTHLHIPYSVEENQKEVLDYLQLNDYQIVALEIAQNSIPIEILKIDPHKKIALLIGNEISGISDYFLKQADQIVHIEMFGKNSSMNVVQATGIAFYELTKKLKHHVKA